MSLSGTLPSLGHLRGISSHTGVKPVTPAPHLSSPHLTPGTAHVCPALRQGQLPGSPGTRSTLWLGRAMQRSQGGSCYLGGADQALGIQHPSSLGPGGGHQPQGPEQGQHLLGPREPHCRKMMGPPLQPREMTEAALGGGLLILLLLQNTSCSPARVPWFSAKEALLFRSVFTCRPRGQRLLLAQQSLRKKAVSLPASPWWEGAQVFKLLLRSSCCFLSPWGLFFWVVETGIKIAV